jgi:hypothetical protein
MGYGAVEMLLKGDAQSINATFKKYESLAMLGQGMVATIWCYKQCTAIYIIANLQNLRSLGFKFLDLKNIFCT